MVDGIQVEEDFILEITETICRCMTDSGVNRAELARRLGTSRANVTQILGGRNFGVRTLARIAHALGRKASAEFVAVPQNEPVRLQLVPEDIT